MTSANDYKPHEIRSDYCAGCQRVTFTSQMHWTIDGLYRCDTCDPIKAQRRR